ncbi:MAG: deoxyguanosinetriphosphate triphosphohydrolase [Actinomycetota bacterium]|nr:deoxyguanosinetriphosphate triphosphohydrolase [Actinomycetota bacterium]
MSAHAAPPYTDSDVERLVSEQPKTAVLAGAEPGERTAFARDRARVLHSGAFRRLAGKTQVVPPDEGDVPRTRLTHSLEVAQISRGIGSQLGCDADLVDLSGLAHDIGHPPFGHNGEAALDSVGELAGGFEANAQNLRLLTFLEPKMLTVQGESAGLNLTRASLDAVIKYPWTRPASGGKFGAYADETDELAWIRPQGGVRLCLEAQVMDWADDVAYSVHDVEDGILSGRIDLAQLADPDERLAVAESARTSHSAESAGDLAEVLGDLLQLPVVAAAVPFRHGLVGEAALKRTTSELTGRLVTGAVAATKHSAGPGLLARYGADLVVPRRLRAEVAMLKAIAIRYVMDDPVRLRVQADQQQLLAELVATLTKRGADALDATAAPRFVNAADDAARLRVILDQVSLLTDVQAIAWHRRLVVGVDR